MVSAATAAGRTGESRRGAENFPEQDRLANALTVPEELHYFPAGALPALSGLPYLPVLFGAGIRHRHRRHRHGRRGTGRGRGFSRRHSSAGKVLEKTPDFVASTEYGIARFFTFKRPGFPAQADDLHDNRDDHEDEEEKSIPATGCQRVETRNHDTQKDGPAGGRALLSYSISPASSSVVPAMDFLMEVSDSMFCIR